MRRKGFVQALYGVMLPCDAYLVVDVQADIDRMACLGSDDSGVRETAFIQQRDGRASQRLERNVREFEVVECWFDVSSPVVPVR